MEKMHEHPDELDLLRLWERYVYDQHIESGRILAIKSSASAESGVAQACVIYLLEYHQNDIGIVLTLLSYLQQALIETQAWPRFVTGQVRGFLSSALKHPEISVRADAVCLLGMAEKRATLETVLHKAGARGMLTELRRFYEEADEDEKQGVDRICQRLASDDFPSTPQFFLSEIQQIVLDLERKMNSYQMQGENLRVGPLLEFAQYQALLASAGDCVVEADEYFRLSG